MEFRISDTFLDSLSKLTNQEQKSVKITVFNLQTDPAHPGLRFHKLDRSQDPRFASVRVNRDIRVIVHRSDSSLLVCYVAHHNDAYHWAQRRKLETHPTTGAAQIVEVRETVEEIVIPTYVTEQRPKPRLFNGISDDDLLAFGVPPEWLEDVRQANEDSLLELADHLPAEAAEALLELATGGTPIMPEVVAPDTDPFDHPDALRRFRVMIELEELERALESPWDKWSVFLHPQQRAIVTGDFSGPARVSGSAGTGKTVVALHRAVHLAESNPDVRVLLATFSDTLANALKTKLRTLIYKRPRLAERIDVYSMDAIGERLYRLNIGEITIASNEDICEIIKEVADSQKDNSISLKFLLAEWEHIVDAWQVVSLEAYQSVPRLGRKTRLPESQRAELWSLFEKILNVLKAKQVLTHAQMFEALSDYYSDDNSSPFDFVVIDESQDIHVSQLKFLARFLGRETNGLFFTGDLGQRIFRQPFSWKAIGVDIRGRSKTLRINYRTSHQIRMQADKLLDPELADVDGVKEVRKDTVSVFNGPQPVIRQFNSVDEETEFVTQWIENQISDGIQPEEIGIIVRSVNELNRAKNAISGTDHRFNILDRRVSTTTGYLSVCTMQLAKGLEFRAVAVMGCDSEVIPSQERIEVIADESDLEEVYNTERYLLYVACTRARDKLLITSTAPVSEFLDDLRQ